MKKVKRYKTVCYVCGMPVELDMKKEWWLHLKKPPKKYPHHQAQAVTK